MIGHIIILCDIELKLLFKYIFFQKYLHHQIKTRTKKNYENVINIIYLTRKHIITICTIVTPMYDNQSPVTLNLIFLDRLSSTIQLFVKLCVYFFIKIDIYLVFN